ncbi:hypothetical protein N798_00280 [Knoellia flava TL1]|uniref:Uncharacterized protein n=2 Tax=Knoellia flava TaxID=913969 RepID=A0A8H9FVZ5_9MICO|nr:hypothetical protein [Knoellia flava]KGN35729.1 hypothetical protein N798_00280 [Knoellia flava TL1]GGB81322.1 hypothetical protein GCM10011314_21160 [Knoellia flava]
MGRETEGDDDDKVGSRAELLPEEQAVGSDDPDAQARAILAESEERTEHPEETRRESTQTPDPDPAGDGSHSG